MSGEAGITSPAVERAVAALLGVDDDTARAAVDALVAAGRLGEGVALHALLHAARRGSDAAGALTELAEGAAPASGWSDYEQRVAEEEAGDEVRLPLVPEAAAKRLVVAAGADAPLLVLRALEGGATAVAAGAEAAIGDGLAPGRARCDHAFVAVLARVCGARLVPRDDRPPTPETTVDETVPRARGYVDVLATL